MRIVVQKYGGSSVGDLQRIGRVADRIAATRDDGACVVVVVSAMGNTTDQLLDLARHMSARPDRRELDMLVSVGERITMALLAMGLRERGVDAISLTGSQSGIITDEAHADARVVEVRPDRVRQHLEDGQVVIVAGFQGVSREREVTTLGRGGSDTTAVVLAAALGAEHCEICSDVDGVWSADPRVVPQAVQLDRLSLEEALALARGGAKVLFEDAVRYARDRSIEIVASSTFGPGAGTRLTVGPALRERAAAVTGDRQLRLVRLADPSALHGLSERGLRLRRRIGDRLWVDTRNAHGTLDEVVGLEDLGPAAVVTAVGSALGEDPVALAAGDAALEAAGVVVLDCGSGGDACWWSVELEQLDDAVRSVHDALVRT